MRRSLICYLEDDERETINDLRIELDKYKSALRMVQNIQKAANMIIEKVEKWKSSEWFTMCKIFTQYVNTEDMISSWRQTRQKREI